MKLFEMFRSNLNKSKRLHLKTKIELAESLQPFGFSVLVEGLGCYLVGSEFNFPLS